MLSHAEATKQRRELQTDIERSHRAKAGATLRDLREQVHQARVNRNEALTECKAQCRSRRLALRERAHERRRRTLGELRDTYAKERAEAREACLLEKAAVHAKARDPIDRAKGNLDAERKYQAELRRIEQGNRERHRSFHKAHAEERRSESDDVVRSNISPDLQALFERVKRSIKGSTRESRTEAFLRYAEEHAEEALAALDQDSDRIVRELEAQRTKAERALRASPRPTKTTAKKPASKQRTYTPEQLAAVPF